MIPFSDCIIGYTDSCIIGCTCSCTGGYTCSDWSSPSTINGILINKGVGFIVHLLVYHEQALSAF